MSAKEFPIIASDDSLPSVQQPVRETELNREAVGGGAERNYRLPRAGERFRAAVTRLTIAIAAEEMRAFRAAKPALRRLWCDYPLEMQWIHGRITPPDHLASRLGEVRRVIAFEISRHMSFPAVPEPDGEGMFTCHQVPMQILDQCDAIAGAGISRLLVAHYTTRTAQDFLCGGYCSEFAKRQFVITMKVDMIPGLALDARTRMAASWFLNHYRHELQHVATGRWIRSGHWDPAPPAQFHWLQPHELSCVAAQTALLGHIEGRSPADWRELHDIGSLWDLRQWISRFGDADVRHGGHPLTGRRACVLFNRMIHQHSAHLMRAFPMLHGVGATQILEHSADFLGVC